MKKPTIHVFASNDETGEIIYDHHHEISDEFMVVVTSGPFKRPTTRPLDACLKKDISKANKISFLLK